MTKRLRVKRKMLEFHRADSSCAEIQRKTWKIHRSNIGRKKDNAGRDVGKKTKGKKEGKKSEGKNEGRNERESRDGARGKQINRANSRQ